MASGQRTRIVAAKVEIDGSQFRRELQRQAMGIDALSRKTQSATSRMGRAWENLGARMKRARMGSGTGLAGGGMIRGMAGMAGVFGFSQLISETRDFEAALTDMMITGNKSSDWLGQVRRKVLEVSTATGRGKAEVAGYMQAIITQTGDADTALKTLDQMGEVALATGASMESLGGIAVKLGGAMRVQAKDTRQAMNILRSQEKLGSVTMANISNYFGQIASLAPSFGKSGEGLGGVQALGGLFQLGARGFAVDQPGQAATATARFLERLGRSPGKIEKALGIKMRDASGGYLELPEIFKRIGEAGAKDREKFASQGTTLFGIQGYKVAQQLQAAAIAGWDKNQGIYGSASSLFSAGAQDVIGGDAAKRRASDAFKFDQALTEMSNTLQKEMLPALKLATKVMPKLAKALAFVLEHSETLLKLWLGWKGMAFFRRLTAPLGAGGGGMPGMPGGGGYGPGGGRAPVMGPWSGGGAGGAGGGGRRGRGGFWRRHGGAGAAARGAGSALFMAPLAADLSYKLSGGGAKIDAVLNEYKAIAADDKLRSKEIARRYVFKGQRYSSQTYNANAGDSTLDRVATGIVGLVSGKGRAALQAPDITRYKRVGNTIGGSPLEWMQNAWQSSMGQGAAFFKEYRAKYRPTMERRSVTQGERDEYEAMRSLGLAGKGEVKLRSGLVYGGGDFGKVGQTVDLLDVLGVKSPEQVTKKGAYGALGNAQQMLQTYTQGARWMLANQKQSLIKQHGKEKGTQIYESTYGKFKPEEIVAGSSQGKTLLAVIDALNKLTAQFESGAEFELNATIKVDDAKVSNPGTRLVKTKKKGKAKKK